MTSECRFAFNAQQYFDFTQPNDDDNVDSYFEENHEIEHVTTYGILSEHGVEDISNPDDEFFSPMKDSSAGTFLKSRQLRKSCSMNDLNLALQQSDENDLQKKLSKLKISDVSSTASLSKLGRKPKRALSKESLERLAQPKNSQENSKNSKYVSLAEAVKKFQHGTPLRFRNPPAKPQLLHLELTQAKTPKLTTKNRSRPVYAISREEEEKIEIEHAKMFKIRANPVNRKALRAPVKPELLKKPCTVPEPFKLSQTIKKEVPEEEHYEFHARPAPKTTKNPFVVKVESKITLPETPTFLTRHKKEEEKREPVPAVNGNKKVASSPKPFKPTRTQPVPFSFEKRDEIVQKKKEELIKRTLEEEKKAREFHAKPVPKSIRSRANSFSSDGASKSKHELSQQDEEIHTFKAKPAIVLQKKPFQPKKEPHYIEIEEFNLNVERRLEERKEFDRQLKEAEEQQRLLKEQRDLEELQQLEEERAALRKMTEFNAQPIRKYKQVLIEPSYKITEPISPKFYTAERIKNKENMQCN